MMMGAGSGNEQYAACCDSWHACYQTCGASKKSCDEGFKVLFGENVRRRRGL